MYSIQPIGETAMKAWEYRNFSFSERVAMGTSYPPDTRCQVFTGRTDTHGYGQIKDKGRPVLVHRWVWEQNFGAIPEGLHVLHRCDNPACLNPEHLFLGTHGDNMKDKAKKKRGNVPSGAAHKRPMAKITAEQAGQIKELLRRGYRGCDIARDFNVTRNLVSEIKLGKTWAHIP